MSDSPTIRAEAVKIATGLYPHQVEGVAFLMGRRRAILADDMGLGKTRQAVVAATHLEPEGPYLVVCPASVKQNWAREIEMVEPDAETAVVGPQPPPAITWDGWVVINYDILEKHFEIIASRPWNAIVFDEAHYLKNHKSKRSRLCRSLVDGCEGQPVVFSLTGTPLTNRPRDLFPLLQLCGHPMGRSFLSFAKRYCAAEHNGFGWVTDGASNLEELTIELHGIMLRRRKDDVLDLPPKTRTWLNVEVPEGTARRETAEVLAVLMESQSSADSSSGGLTGQDRTRLIAKLTRVRRKLATAKARRTIEYVQNALDQDEKVLVFSCYDAPINRIYKKFADNAVVLTGKTPTPKRQALVDRFQNDPDTRVFVANILAGGVGLNLTAARQVVFNDLDWVPANHWQAEDRAYRIGQTGTVQVSYMVAESTVDEFVRTVLETKAALASAVVDGEALGSWVDRDVLEELAQLVSNLSPRLADTDTPVTEHNVGDLLREASDSFRGETAVDLSQIEVNPNPQLPPEALQALVAALSGPKSIAYSVESNSKSRKGTLYRVEQSGNDFVCSCLGFEYRGTCSHARAVKSAVTSDRPLPPTITRLEEDN
jgi:SNF2 family DNA or RNA helicase